MPEQSFFTRTVRYCAPLWRSPLITSKTILIYSVWGISPIVHIFFIQEIVSIIEGGTRQEFTSIVIWYLLYMLIYEVVDFVTKKWGWVENINAYRNTIDREYISKFIQVDNNEVEKQGTGKLVSIITNGSDTWALSLDMFLLEMTKIIYVFIFACYMFFNVSSLYGILFLLFYMAILAFASYFNAKSLEGRRKRTVFWNNYVKTFVRILMSKVEIMQSGKTRQEIQGINAISNGMVDINRKMAIWVYACYKLAESSVIWLKIGILFYVGIGIFEGMYTLAFFVGLFGIMSIMEGSVHSSMKFFRNFTKDFTKIEQFWNFFDHSPKIQGYDTGETFVYKKGDISLKNLSYGYEANNKVFEGISLDVSGSKVTALVGPSGGGKSTLVKLIAGYITQESGNISVDTQNLAEVSLKSYYSQIGYLTQEPSVFDGTIIENLLYAVSIKPIKKKLEEIIKLAHCDFIYDLPKGLKTEIGERGIKLSGGQKQRLAIAKIFLKDPQIIILDEPTSALDSLSEQKITEAMHNLFAGRTVIIIAHRLQTVKHADDIIVIDSGKVIERGKHTSLVKKGGYYKQMLDLQSAF